VEADSLVIAMKDELLVRRSSRLGSEVLNKQLSGMARYCGSLADWARHRGPGNPPEHSPGAPIAEDVEVWRLKDETANSIDVARALRVDAAHAVTTATGHKLELPSVSPNHVCVVAPHYDFCPASPANPAPAIDGFVPAADGHQATVVVIDTGYIEIAPPHPAHGALDARVSAVAGRWLDTNPAHVALQQDLPDAVDRDSQGRLPGVVGHGTFVAGIIAHATAGAKITVVGQRHECEPIEDLTDPCNLITTEFSIALSLLTHSDADVVSCGFAFPTLDGLASITFGYVMQILARPTDAPPGVNVRRGVAVVSPAGNEQSSASFWPAAHPDVIGVASVNSTGLALSPFSNWGDWISCYACGEDVHSTFIYWTGPIENAPSPNPDQSYTFAGWATWSGTSFAAPRVSGAIAEIVSARGGALTGTEAYERLVAGAQQSNAGGVPRPYIP
jgi:hypothetical protein